MGYARIKTPFPTEEFYSANKPGYAAKLCPYSTNYRDRFSFTGTMIVGLDLSNDPITAAGTFVLGNSTDLSFYGVAVSTYTCSEHTTTSGRMLMDSNPPSWICRDPNCWYKTTTGKFYTEV
jgi:hypothetical protein